MLALLVASLPFASAPVASAELPSQTVVARDTKDGITLWRPQTVIDGQLVVAEVAVPEDCTSPRITWLGKTQRPFVFGDNHVALLPVPLGHVAPDEVLAVQCGRKTTRFSIAITAGTFPESQLSVDPKYSAAAPPRTKNESAAIAAAFRASRKGRAWEGPFLRPAAGVETSPFGVRRTFNGKLESRHRGIDYDGKQGDPVLAANDGVVALVANDFYYVGNAVFIDHGDDLFSLYFHLSRVDVKQGEVVKRGQEIGAIGSTGRVTGPHLHFAVKLLGTYVNPGDLLSFDPGMRLSDTAK